MSASEPQARDAIAFQLAAAVDKYDEAVEKLIATWLDMDRYRDVSEQVDHIGTLSGSLPQVSVAWVSLLISHSELIHCLWKCGDKLAAPSLSLDECRMRHSHAITKLRNDCVRFCSKAAR